MKKKIMLMVCALVLVPVVCFAVYSTKALYSTTLVFSASSIAGSGTITSGLINLDELRPEGYFTIKLTSAGAGSTIKAEYLVCDTRGGTYYEPSGATDIVAAHAVGTTIYSFTPPVAKYMKIKLTENTGNDVSSFAVVLTVQ